MAKDIAIFGAGGLGREVACLIRDINEACYDEDCRYNFIGFFDDNVAKGTQISSFGVVLGNTEDINNWPKDLDVSIAIGNPTALKLVSGQITNPLVSFPNLIHPSVYYGAQETISFGKGNIVQGGCAFTCDIKIGNFNVFNGSVVLGHDCEIGNYNVIMPSRISGTVRIGECNLIGVGSIVLQQLRVGNDVKLGAGSVLMTHPKDNSTYIGNPARIFKY